MTNKQELREAAEKATQGKWRRASTRFNGITAQSAYPLCGKEDILANAAEKRDAEFIAAANPATVLALLDELEAAESLAKQQGNIAVALFDEVTTLRRNADDKAPELRSQLEEAEKRITELEVPTPELKMAHLINKFYERYPLEEFKSDTERSAALGYFMAGAELQCFGEFINYAELMGDE